MLEAKRVNALLDMASNAALVVNSLKDEMVRNHKLLYREIGSDAKVINQCQRLQAVIMALEQENKALKEENRKAEERNKANGVKIIALELDCQEWEDRCNALYQGKRKVHAATEELYKELSAADEVKLQAIGTFKEVLERSSKV